MATITYDAHDTCTNVTVTPASDAENITITLGFHPSSMNGVKLKDVDEVALIYWNPLLVNFTVLVGADFAAGDETVAIQTSFALVGPDPLVGDGVSKERLALGVLVYGGLVTEAIPLHMTFHR